MSQEKTITAEAEELVFGDRNKAYGCPLVEYERTAAMITAMIRHKLQPGEEVTAEDAIRFMAILKLSRDVNLEKRDNMVDLAGYALLRQWVSEKRKRRTQGPGV